MNFRQEMALILGRSLASKAGGHVRKVSAPSIPNEHMAHRGDMARRRAETVDAFEEGDPFLDIVFLVEVVGKV